MDFGLAAGLAYRHNWGQDMQNATNLHMMRKQAEIDQENKAKLLSDDVRFGSANNKWDSAIIKKNSEIGIKEIGKFASENPDWMINAEKRVKMRFLKDSLLNNEHVQRGMRVDTHYANMMKYVQDPKNAMMANDPAIKDAIAAYQRYSTTGSASLDPNEKKEFMFVAPEELVDTNKILQQYAHATSRDQIVHAEGGLGAYKQFVSDSNKDKVAASILSNGAHGKYMVADFNRLSPEEQKQHGSVHQYIKNRMEPWLPEQQYHEGHIFNPNTTGSKNGANAIEHANPWMRDVIVPLMQSNDPNYRVQGNPHVSNHILQNPDGQIDLRDSEFSWNGKQINNIDLGLIKATALGRHGKRTAPNGKVYFTDDVAVDMPIDDFVRNFKDDAIDYGGLQNVFGNSDFEIRPEWSKNVKKVTDKDGNAKVQVIVQKQIPNSMMNGAIYNKGAHGKSHEYSTDPEVDYNIIEDSTGNRFKQYSDGTTQHIQ